MRRESNERKREHGYIREQSNVREEKAYVTQLYFAAGIVVMSVRVHRAKEQGEMLDRKDAEGREREKEGQKGSRKDGKRRKQKAIAYERQLAPLMARENKTKQRRGRSVELKHNKAHTRAEKGGRGGGEEGGGE